MRRKVRRGVTTATTKYHTAYRALSRGRKVETTGASDVAAPAKRRRTRLLSAVTIGVDSGTQAFDYEAIRAGLAPADNLKIGKWGEGRPNRP